MDPWKRAGTWALGIAFLLVGLAGVLLPILHGVLFLVAGLLVLSRVSPRAARTLSWAEERVPDRLVRKAYALRRRYTNVPEPEEDETA